PDAPPPAARRGDRRRWVRGGEVAALSRRARLPGRRHRRLSRGSHPRPSGRPGFRPRAGGPPPDPVAGAVGRCGGVARWRRPRAAATRRTLKPAEVLILSVAYDHLLRPLVVNRLHARLTRRRRRAGWTTCFAEHRFREPEIRAALEHAGFEVLASHPDDYDPPYAEGLWVDYQNLVFDPTSPPAPEELFRPAGLKGRVATALLRLAPWTFCGEVALVARAR